MRIGMRKTTNSRRALRRRVGRPSIGAHSPKSPHSLSISEFASQSPHFSPFVISRIRSKALRSHSGGHSFAVHVRLGVSFLSRSAPGCSFPGDARMPSKRFRRIDMDAVQQLAHPVIFTIRFRIVHGLKSCRSVY